MTKGLLLITKHATWAVGHTLFDDICTIFWRVVKIASGETEDVLRQVNDYTGPLINEITIYKLPSEFDH